MKSFGAALVAPIAIGAVTALGAIGSSAVAQETPQRGGILKFVVAGEPPSFDGHRETTYALIHPIRPFYSTLVRINPDNPTSTTDFVCDLCTEMPTPENEGKRYAFEIRENVKFHDGSPLTAHDVVASWMKIVDPPEGVGSARKGFYSMVENISAPDDHTVVFDLQFATDAFMPALAIPFNFIYPKAKLDEDPNWFEKNVLGSGPFKFEERVAGASITGSRNEDYYLEGRPYIDGFEAIFAPKQSVRVQAIRGDRAAIEFRGFPPKSRDDLVEALGDKITVEESDWNCVNLLTPNINREPFDDVRVRRALTLAVDRWGGSQYLSQIAIVKTPGGIVYPGDPLAATKEELEQMAGYWPDIEKSREEARRLLEEAGVQTPLKITMNNRGVDQPYKIVGTWLVDQLRQVGFEVEQQVKPTGPFFDSLRTKKDWDISVEFNCQSIVNPLIDTSKFLSANRVGNNYGGYNDEELDRIYDEMLLETDKEKQRELMRQYEKLILDEQAYTSITLWWYRIVPYRSYVKGWGISPSHYLNQSLDNVWLDQSKM